MSEQADPMVYALNHLWSQREKLMTAVKWLLTSDDEDSRASALALIKEIEDSNGQFPKSNSQELLEALKVMVNQPKLMLLSEAITIAKNAIAKATGGTE